MDINEIIKTLENDANFQTVWAMRDSSPMIRDLVRGRDLARFVDWRLRSDYDQYVERQPFDDDEEDAIVVCALTAHLLVLALVEQLGKKIAQKAGADYMVDDSAIRDGQGMIAPQPDGRGVVAACSYDGMCGAGIECCVRVGGKMRSFRFSVELDSAFRSAVGFDGDPLHMLRDTAVSMMFADLGATPIYESDEVAPFWVFVEKPIATLDRLCRDRFEAKDIGR